MIVISVNVTLSVDEAADGITSDNPRIGYHNLATESNVTATETEASGFPVTNVALPATHLRWRSSNTNAQAVVLSLTAAEVVNYYAIAGHNFGSTGATVKLQSSTDGMTWADVTTERMPGNDHVFMEEFADEEKQYYRLLITPGTAAPEIATVHIGRVLRMQRRLYVGHKPLTLNLKTDVSSGRSESGQFLGRVLRREMLEGDAAFSNLTPSWVRAYFVPFEEYAKTGPFFFAWRPGEYPDEVGYCWLKSDSELPNARPNGMMDAKLNMQGLR